MKVHFLKKSIKAKLLYPVSTALFFCIFSLVVVIITVQNNFQEDMIESTSTLLEESQQTATLKMNQVNSDIENSLSELAAVAGRRLSETTEKKLSREEENVASSYQDVLRDNAKAIAGLLANVAPTSILSYDYLSLIGLSKAVSENQNIVFAIFVDNNDKLLTRYINKEDPIIQKFITTGAGKKQIDKVLDAAQNDSDVFLYEQPIAIEGHNLGKVILCISTIEVKERIGAMSNRFVDLVNTNSQIVNNTLIDESGKVKDKLNLAMNVLKDEEEKSTLATADNIASFNKRITSTTRNLILTGGAVCILFIFFILFFVVRSISNPLKDSVEMITEMKSGHLNKKRVNGKGSDEIGMLSSSLNQMTDKLVEVINSVHESSDIVLEASGKMSFASEQVSKLSQEGSSDAENVSNLTSQAATDLNNLLNITYEINNQSQEIWNNSNEMNQSVSTVAVSIEQMSSSIYEVAEHCSKAAKLSTKAQNKSESSSEKIKELEHSSKQIDQIIYVINAIAEQTKLLALNANIEAARAGEAGKGFSVVANEIKDLAHKTAEATNDITVLIKSMQERITGSVSVINEITRLSAQVNEINTSISVAIEEQSATTKEISKNISEASKATNNVHTMISDLSSSITEKVTPQIEGTSNSMNEASKTVANVSANSKNTTQEAFELNTLAQKLASLADDLKRKVSFFQIT